jgi:hypothetical protein
MNDATQHGDPRQLGPMPSDYRTPTEVTAEGELEHAVDFILDECFLIVGQAIGMRTTVDFPAIVWWRDHFHKKFMTAMRSFGNRWSDDRTNVTAVALMLAERAVRYASGKSSIDEAAARQAAADVQRYCALHSRRTAAVARQSNDGLPRIAGYWCIDVPPPSGS